MIFKGKSLKSVADKFLGKLLPTKDESVVEIKADIWKSMYPFFCDQSLSQPAVAVESLKILDVLIDYGIIGDYKNLQKVLLHKNDDVAHFALDVLRKIKGLSLETRTERFEPVSTVPGGEGMEKLPHKKYQKIEEIEQAIQREKDFKSRIFNVLKKEDSIAEKLTDIEEKVEMLSEKTSEIPSNLRMDYDNKFKSLEDTIEELKKSVESKTVSKNAHIEKVVSEKLTEIEEKVEELSEKTSEIPSNLRLDYDIKLKSLEDSIEELKKSVESKTVSENAHVEKVVSEKLTEIEEKVEELSDKTSKTTSNLALDYDNKFKSLEDTIEELKKSLDSKTVSENAHIEKVVSEKLTEIEEKVEELSEKTSEIPSNLRLDYDNKLKSLEDCIEELKKSVDSKIVSEDAHVEKVVSEKLTDIEEKVKELSEKTSEIPSNMRLDYDNKFKSLEDGIEDLKNLITSKIVIENAHVEKVVSEKLTEIEEKVKGLSEKTSEIPSNLRLDYDNKFKSLEDCIEELKKSVESKTVSENALAEKVAGQVLKSIKPDRHILKSGITPLLHLAQKTTDDLQYQEEEGVKLPFLNDSPEYSIILLNWVKFLMEKTGRNNLDNILEYYVEIGWISEEVCSMMANYAEGIDYYVEKSTWNLPEVHAKSLLFIEQLRRQKKDTRRVLHARHTGMVQL